MCGSPPVLPGDEMRQARSQQSFCELPDPPPIRDPASDFQGANSKGQQGPSSSSQREQVTPLPHLPTHLTDSHPVLLWPLTGPGWALDPSILAPCSNLCPSSRIVPLNILPCSSVATFVAPTAEAGCRAVARIASACLYHRTAPAVFITIPYPLTDWPWSGGAASPTFLIHSEP